MVVSIAGNGTIIVSPKFKPQGVLHDAFGSRRFRDRDGFLCAYGFSISLEHYRAGDFRLEDNTVLASFPSASHGKYDFRRWQFSSLQFQSIISKRPKRPAKARKRAVLGRERAKSNRSRSWRVASPKNMKMSDVPGGGRA
jgi:hypothetical protein